MHLLNDNAAHTGHLDIAREQIDGAVWDFTLGRVRQPDKALTVGLGSVTSPFSGIVLAWAEAHRQGTNLHSRSE